MNKVQTSYQKFQDVAITNLMSLKYIYGFGGGNTNRQFIFDLSTQDKNNGKKILYIAGNNTVIANLETKEQMLINGTEGATRVSFVAVNQDRTAIAIAEDMPQNSIITIYEYKNDKLKKKKTLICKEFESISYECITFGSGKNSKILAAISRTPSHKLLTWEWEKGKLKNTCDFAGFNKINGLFFSSVDDDFLFAIGNSTTGLPIKCFWLRSEHEAFTVAPKNDLIKDFLKSYNKNLLTFCMLSDGSVVFANDKGELILFSRQYELKCVLPNSPIGVKISNISQCGKGIMVCGSRMQLIHYEKIEREMKSVWQRTDTSFFPPTPDELDCINSLVILEEQNLLVGLSSGELNLITILSDQNFKIEPALSAFHSGQVIDIDICDRKPYMISCGTDKMIKIWNYVENTLEYQRKFDKDIFAVSFHCSGLYMAIGFKEKIKIAALTITEIKLVYDILIRDSKIIKFSNGGHLIASCCENSVQIWDFYTGEFKNNIILKTSESPINSLQWAIDDLRIFVGSNDGSITEILIKEKLCDNIYSKPLMPIKNFHLWNEYKTNGSSTFTISVTIDKSLIVQSYFSEDENGLKKQADKLPLNGHQQFGATNIGNFNAKNDEKFHRMRVFKLDDNISSAIISNSGKYLFCASEEKKGVLKVLNFPEMSSAAELNLNQNGIKKMMLSSDDLNLFLIGEDNSIVFIELKDKELKAKKNKEGTIGYIEELLADEVKARKVVDEIDSLSKKVNENEKIIEMKILKDNRTKEEEIDGLNQKMLQIVEERREKVKVLTAELEDFLKNEKEALSLLESNHQELKSKMDSSQKTKIELKKQKLEEMKGNYAQILEQNKIVQEELKLNHNKNLEKIEIVYNEKLAEMDQKLEEVEKEIKIIEKTYDEQIDKIEIELDKRIQTKKELHEKELEETMNDKNHRDYEVNASRLDFFNKEAKKREEDKKQKDINDEIKNITEEIFVLTKETENNQKEISEREKTILQKLERINELIRKKQELDKFKFVLHYKIEELKKEKGPREIEIAKMKQQLQNMQQEIHLFSKNYSILKLSVSEMRLKLQGQSKVLKESQLEIAEKSNVLTSFRTLLSEATTIHINDYKELKKRLLFLYNTYVINESRLKEENVDKQKIFSEQRAYLENCLRALKDKFAKNIALHKTDHKRAMKENVDLIGAINELKREKKFKVDNEDKIKNLKVETKKEIEMALDIRKKVDLLNTLKDKLLLTKKDLSRSKLI